MRGKVERNGRANGGDRPSRLIGWLVSYALDSQGKAFELRSGRYLISRKGLEAESTITLDGQDISSPHLAMHASQKHVLMVQDIFSETGSFLRKASGGEEAKITGPVKLEHGDWLRIGGTTRFQVCLIDGTGR